MTTFCDQWIRKCTLVLVKGEEGLDLSEFRIKFRVQNANVESPNSASIRVYNLAPATINKIQVRGEFSEVILQAGYVDGNYGVIFRGTIVQFRIGRESNTDSYLDILAADGDELYNQFIVAYSNAKGTTPEQAVARLEKETKTPVDIKPLMLSDPQHFINPAPRGSVEFGLARATFRNMATSLDASWSIQDGQVIITSNKGYLEGDVVKINSGTGMIGIPEQTDDGIHIKCLLNSRLRIGHMVQLDNSDITELKQRDPNAAQMAYNSRVQIQDLAPLSPDGSYQAMVVEHEGDTRGQAWYSSIIGLAIDRTSPAYAAVDNR